MATGIETALREHKARHVRLLVEPGSNELSGHLRGLLERDDGLVAFLVDGAGRLHTIHYHPISAVYGATAA
jgi:hypothetical protein